MATRAPRFDFDPNVVTPAELIEQLGAEVASRYAAAEDEMIRIIAKLARRGIETPPDIIERLETLKTLRREAARIAAEIRSDEVVAKIVRIAADEGQAAAVRQLGLAGVPAANTAGITTGSASAVAQMALDLSNSLDAMERRITRWMPDVYQTVISMNAPTTILGVGTLKDSQKRSTEQFLAKGITGFRDAADRNWKPGTYAEMATRTTVNRAWQYANTEQMRSVGINLVQIIVGNDACKICHDHAGKIYSTDGTPAGQYIIPDLLTGKPITVTVAGTLDQAKAEGWNHPNCRCVAVGYFAGLPAPKGSTWDAQKNADRERLRELERQLRHLKRREAAAMDDVTGAKYTRLIKAKQAEIRKFVDETDQLRKNYREQLSFSDGSPASAFPALKAITT